MDILRPFTSNHYRSVCYSPLALCGRYRANKGESMSALSDLLQTFRKDSATNRERGTYFEELILNYLRHEPTYRDLYSDVWMYSDWAARMKLEIGRASCRERV